MNTVICAYKELGATPLETLESSRLENNLDTSIPMTYAGRLDPMAEGVLVILTGDNCREENKKKYLNLDKEYISEILVGFETDSYDLLGKVVSSNESENLKSYDDEIVAIDLFKSELSKWTGEFEQSYPIYSSKTVGGIQLFNYGKNNQNVILPKHKVNIHSLEYIDDRIIEKKELEKYLIENILKVKGDFRQKEILDIWHEELNKNIQGSFLIFKIKISCGSGMYVRQLVSDIGNDMKIPMVLFSLKRTRVGEYVV